MSNLISVSGLNQQIKSLLEVTFIHTQVEGEVASLTYHSSGHLYFSIKDNQSTIKCIMWRSNLSKLKFRVEKGLHIVIEGSVGVYTPRGEYQFYAVNIEPYGKGSLAIAYEQLKEKLKAKGYFEDIHKKNIPKYITKLALVTAKESAGLYDMLKIISYRYPAIEVVIVDTLVQGENASFEIVCALSYADTIGADVVIVGRGGGSTEDLWVFNEERVAEAIFSMKTPIVSAVGHEIDILLSDFVADLRAPTPSASIEMILPDKNELLYLLNEQKNDFKQILEQKIRNNFQEITHQKRLLSYHSPLLNLDRGLELSKELALNFLKTIQSKLSYFADKALLIEEQIILNNPKNNCRKGWAKISLNNKIISLAELKKNQKFILEDEKSKIEAVLLEKL